MKEFKFFKGQVSYTVQELIDYAWEYSLPYRFHPNGCLISKSAYRAFVLGPIRDNEIKTLREVENQIREHSMTPEQALESKRYMEIESEYPYTIDEHQEEFPEFEIDPS